MEEELSALLARPREPLLVLRLPERAEQPERRELAAQARVPQQVR